MKKCYLYLRAGSEQQAQGDGLDRQESMLIKYFNVNVVAQGFEPEYELIIDKGLSAFKAEHLHDTAGLGKFFAHVREGGGRKSIRTPCRIFRQICRSGLLLATGAGKHVPASGHGT